MKGVVAPLFAAWVTIASPSQLHATDLSKGPTRSQAVTKLGCPLAILWIYIEIGQSCSLRDDFQRQLERSAAQIEGYILSIDPDAADALRKGRTSTKHELGAEIRSGEICTGGRDRAWLDMYNGLRARGSEDLRGWRAEVMETKPNFLPPDCV